VDSSPSPVGYWVYEPPRRGEPAPCDGREGALRWDFRWFQRLGTRHELDEAATRDLILAFAARPEVEKILLEPHLKERLEITNPKVRFQGCEAARHDDHFHVQFR
jgi:murein endopeptidase